MRINRCEEKRIGERKNKKKEQNKGCYGETLSPTVRRDICLKREREREHKYMS